MRGEFLKSKSAQRSTQVEQARQKGLIFKSVGLPCVEVAWNTKITAVLIAVIDCYAKFLNRNEKLNFAILGIKKPTSLEVGKKPKT